MNHILLSVLFVFAFSACKQSPKTIIVAGDSWGFYVCFYKSLDTALQLVGIKDTTTNSTCAVTTRVGIRTSAWLGSEHDKATEVALHDPSTKVLYLSLGGNDVMNEWHKDMSEEDSRALFTDIKARVIKITDKYKRLRPDVKILVAGYDYPRFVANHPMPNYRAAYEAMGSPTPLEINNALITFTKIMAELNNPNENIFYIHHLGLMHYHYGNPEAGLEAKTTLSPEMISSPEYPGVVGGNPHYQTGTLGMLYSSTLKVADAFHLSRRGYDRLADQTVSHYLYGWLTGQ